jgi:hypothetical protein
MLKIYLTDKILSSYLNICNTDLVRDLKVLQDLSDCGSEIHAQVRLDRLFWPTHPLYK